MTKEIIDDASTGENKPEAVKKKGFLQKLKSLKFIVPIVLLLVIIVVYFYQDSQIRAIKAKSEEDKKEIIEQSNKLIAEKNEYFLTLISTPFSWALRSALLTGNVELVNQYLYEFIKNKNYELILVTDASGKVISSTDKKLEGTSFSSYYDAALIASDSIKIDNSVPGKLFVASPIMGFNTKLGSMFSIYVPEPAMELKAEVEE